MTAHHGESADPHDLARFVAAQLDADPVFAQVLERCYGGASSGM
jgi:uncharacterized protein (DUF1810 family)